MVKQEDLMSFRGQRDGEEVISMLRQHPWTLARPGVVVSLGVAVIIMMFIWFQASAPSVWTLFILAPILLLYGGYAWFKWWNTLYLLTDQRLVLVFQRGIWSRRIEDYNLAKIQSVASDTDGPAGTMMNFGTVAVAIMGIKEPVQMPRVEDPYAVQEKILAQMRTLETSQPLRSDPAPIGESAQKRVE